MKEININDVFMVSWVITGCKGAYINKVVHTDYNCAIQQLTKRYSEIRNVTIATKKGVFNVSKKMCYSLLKNLTLTIK